MKTHTKKTSLSNLTRLSTSRNVTKMNSFVNSTNHTSSLFGPRKNVLMTYSKARPFQIVKKGHFLTPETPHVATPDSLQITVKEQSTVTNLNSNTKTDHSQQGGSFTTANLLSITGEEKNSLNLANSVGITLKPKKLGSNLALRNISNIPIENTLSRTQCTPTQPDNQTIQPSRRHIPSKNATRKSTPHCSKLKSRVLSKRLKESVSSLALKEISEEQRSSQEKQTTKTQKLNIYKCELRLPHLDSTNYSVKSMSSGTDISSRSSNRQGKTLTAQSMSLCTTNEIAKVNSSREQSNEDTLVLPKNSTFNESGEKPLAKDYLKVLLSPIEDEIHIKQKENKASSSSTTQCQQSCIEQDLCEGGPRTSTPVDQGKDNGALSDEPEFSPILEDKEPTTLTKTNGVSKKQDGQMNKNTTQSKTISTNIKKKQVLHPKENSKDDVFKAYKPNKSMSLPLQASMCIEDDSDKEYVPENITPEIMPPKPVVSSSKRKLEYCNTSMPFKPNTDCCFLLDFKCTVKKPCKLWMRTERLSPTDIAYPKDDLTYQ